MWENPQISFRRLSVISSFLNEKDDAWLAILKQGNFSCLGILEAKYKSKVYSYMVYEVWDPFLQPCWHQSRLIPWSYLAVSKRESISVCTIPQYIHKKVLLIHWHLKQKKAIPNTANPFLSNKISIYFFLSQRVFKEEGLIVPL